MTYNIKYTLVLEDGSYDKEINIKNRESEYIACSDLCLFLKSKYKNCVSHSVKECNEIRTEDDLPNNDAFNFLKNTIFSK